MPAKVARRGGKKNRKYGRMETWCKWYRASGRWMVNKRRKLLKHLRWNPNDAIAATSLNNMTNWKAAENPRGR